MKLFRRRKKRLQGDWRPLEDVPRNQLVEVIIEHDGMERIIAGMLITEVGWEIADPSIKEFTVRGWREYE